MVSATLLEVDATKQDMITDEQAQYFLDNGFLVIRSLLRGEELRLVQEEMMKLVKRGMKADPNDPYYPDYLFWRNERLGRDVFARVEYVIDKSDVMKALLGHPFILRSVEKLQGRNFIPTWDSMVVKIPENGAIVPWHRDAEPPYGCTDPRPIFNVDFYLDETNMQTCLWVIPGSNKWPKEEADARCKRPGFDTSDAVPGPMKPGDVIFHNIMVLHGSPEGNGNPLRRTVYYEFRPGEIEAEFGPHTLQYLTLKQEVLLDCIERRKQMPYAAGETPFEYRPHGLLALHNPRKPETYRFPHRDFWRAFKE